LVSHFQKGCGMLVISRKRGDRILVGDDIVIEVADIRGDKVRIGISAPKDVPVHREEVWLAIQEQGKRGERD
jgi:carbon storage regulator